MRALLAMIKSRNLWYSIYTHRIYLYGFVAVVCVGVYVGILLFGDNSLSVLMRNITQKEELIDEVNALQVKNARLQKDLFELKGLEP